MKRLFIFISFILFSSVVFGQAAGDYQSNAATGNWTNNTSWQRHNGSIWVNCDAGTYPTDTSGLITILNGHNITANSNISIDSTVIASGGTLTVGSGVTLTVANGNGDDLTNNGTITITVGSPFPPPPTTDGKLAVDGKLVHNGTAFNNTSVTRLEFKANSYYDHQVNPNTYALPVATWNTSSTCEVSGSASGLISLGNLNQSFGNFILNSTGLTGSDYYDFNGQLTDVNGDFDIQSTGSGSIYLSLSTTYTLNIDGDFILGSGTTVLFTFTPSVTINVLQNFSSDAGYLLFTNANTTTLDVDGDFTIGSGFVDFTFNAAGTTLINIGGDIDILGSTLSKTADGTVTITADGSADQVFVSDLTTSPALNIDFVVGNSSSTLDMSGYDLVISGDVTLNSSSALDVNTGYIESSGTFTVNSTGNLSVGSTHASGAIQTGTTSGNIRVSGTRTYTSGCTIAYNGTGAQFLGNGYPSSGNVNLEIDNTSGISLSGNTIINSSYFLSFTNGSLSLGAYSLTLNGTVSGTTSFSGGSTSDLSIGGSGAFGSALNFASGARQLDDLTINRTSSTVSLGTDLTISGTFTHTAGGLDISDDRLQISGVYSTTSGSFTSNASSVLEIDGSGAFSTLSITSALDTLILNRASTTVSTSSSLSVDALVLTNGTFTATNMSVNDGGSIQRTINGVLTNAPGGTDQYSVSYSGTGSLTTGNELPAAASTRLLNLTNNADNATLNKNISIYGVALFNSGTFNASTYTINMYGSNWTVNGAFSPGTSSTSIVNLDGTVNIGGTGSLSFHRLDMAASSNITFLSSATVQLTGNLNLNSTATLSQAPSKFLLNGSTTQQIQASGNTIPTIEINKTAGDVNLTNQLNVSNSIEIISNTTINSQGNLVLISTASTDACIKALPAGADITGNVTVQRHLDADDNAHVWRHISSPVRGATIGDLAGYFWISHPVYYYDETLSGTVNERWATATSGSDMTPTMGFIVVDPKKTIPVTWESVGVLIKGDTTVNLDMSDKADLTNNGWNFIGNPYPSSIDWTSGSWTKTKIDAAAYVRDFGSGTYLFNDGTGSSTFNGIIATGQGFWVHANDDSPQLGFSEQTKTTTTGTFYRMAKPKFENRIVAILSHDEFSDKAFIYLRKKATDAYDKGMDNFKMSNEIFNIATISGENHRFCIDYRQKTKDRVSIKLDLYNFKKDHPSYHRFDFSQPLDYTLSFEDIETVDNKYTVHLYDHFLNEVYDLREESSFTVRIDPSDPETFGDQRFELVINDNAEDDDDEIDSSNPRELIVYPNPAKKKITIRFKGSKDDKKSKSLKFNIIDPKSPKVVINGQLKKNKKHYIAEVDVSKLKKGMYLVQVIGINKVYYLKFIKK